jgi:hypothetical protein
MIGRTMIKISNELTAFKKIDSITPTKPKWMP